MTHSFSRLIAAASLIALIGAGCPQPSKVGKTGKPPAGNTAKIAVARGFGNLPSPDGAQAPLGSSPETISARASGLSANAVLAPAAPGVGIAQDATGKVIGRPIPVPPPLPRPATITYAVEGAVPTWPSEDNVLRYANASYPSTSLSALASATGLPGQAFGSGSELQSFNFSWIDSEKIQWTFDAAQRIVSFWRQDDTVRILEDGAPTKTPPDVDEKEMVRIADDFLARHGFGNTQRGQGTIEAPWGGVMKGGATYPCPMLEAARPEQPVASDVAVGSGGGSAGVSAIAPCWYPIDQVTVVYDSVRDGKKITDTGGGPFRGVSVTIRTKDKKVNGGNIWLDRETESSKYPLISAEEGLKRLKAGGRNPIWPWMDNGGDIAVHLKTVELVWMRYDVWTEKGNETYLIPALGASGTVEYSKDNIQPYWTVVPLVADDAFERVKPPEPVPLPAAQTAPAAAGAVAPAKP